MKITVLISDLKQVFTAEEQAQEWFPKLIRWKADKEEIDITVDDFTDDQLARLQDVAKKHKDAGAVRKLSAYRNMLAQSAHETLIKRLEMLSLALTNYIGKLSNKWIFKERSDGKVCPCYVGNIEYEPSDSHSGNPAYTQLEYYYIERNEKQHKRVTWNTEDLKGGKTVIQALADEGLYAETPDLTAQYEKEMDRYAEVNNLTGTQFHAIGDARAVSHYAYENIPMVRDGEPAKVVMDDETTDDDDENGGRGRRKPKNDASVSAAFWARKGAKGQEVDDEASIILPVHPYVQVFDLKAHDYVLIHTGNLVNYVYDKTVIDKLVLPMEEKDLITILIAGSNDLLEDIVKGKTGGTVIISTGPPGCGKTLSSEVCAEALERPLYAVQCAQLGTDEEKLEQRLKTVLARASRWKAVLLVDEADVYVHERGTDIQQNAIVGVWLRLIEYYRGIMFLTSNREVIIDDAIMSRATAHLRYQIPTEEDLGKLWEILSAQYQVSLAKEDVLDLRRQFLGISGRTVKNLLKLARQLAAAKKSPVDVAMIKYVARFLDIECKEKDEA